MGCRGAVSMPRSASRSGGWGGVWGGCSRVEHRPRVLSWAGVLGEYRWCLLFVAGGAGEAWGVVRGGVCTLLGPEGTGPVCCCWRCGVLGARVLRGGGCLVCWGVVGAGGGVGLWWVSVVGTPVCVWGGDSVGVGAGVRGIGARSLFENCTVDASIFSLCVRMSGEVCKSTGWMPWHQEPMKDVGACVKPRGVGNQALIRGYPNGGTRLGSCPVTGT